MHVMERHVVETGLYVRLIGIKGLVENVLHDLGSKSETDIRYLLQFAALLIEGHQFLTSCCKLIILKIDLYRYTLIKVSRSCSPPSILLITLLQWHNSKTHNSFLDISVCLWFS